MPRLEREEYVLFCGKKFQVEFYFNEKGMLPVREYFDSLPRMVQVKLLALVKYIADEGRIFDERKYRIVDRNAKIYEFKPMSERFFNFFYKDKKIIITNAYRKKGQKLDRRELAVAIGLRRDYESRVEGGSYYEAEKI